MHTQNENKQKKYRNKRRSPSWKTRGQDKEEIKMKKNSKDKIIPHGRTFSGIVTSRKMHKTAKVTWERRIYLKKYERYEKRRSGVMAHVSDDMQVKEGDKVIIQECRPISKTKHFIIIKNESK